jgi:hypothetical protein
MDTRSSNSKILGLYNNFHSNPEFKKESDNTLLITELNFKKYMLLYGMKFTLTTLSACKTPFANYIAKYGKLKPAHTSYPTINYYLNKAAYYSYNFFRTNQPYATRIMAIIEKTEEKIQDNKEHRIDIFMALKEIKKIYDEMIAEKILTGEVISSIYLLFNKFDLQLIDNELRLITVYDTGFAKEKVNQSIGEIEATIFGYPVEFIKGRIDFEP